MSERYGNIIITLKGTKHTESVPTGEMDFLTWSKLLEMRGLDSKGVTLIADGRLVREFDALVFDNMKSHHTVNLMILVTKGQDPNMNSIRSISFEESREISVDNTAGILLSCGNAAHKPADRYLDLDRTKEDILIPNNNGEACLKVLKAARGTRRYRIRVCATGMILQEVAEALGKRIHMNNEHLIFIHRGKRYGAEHFHVSIDDWPDNTNMSVMFNTNHWDDVERRAWRDSQILLVDAIAKEFDTVSNASAYRAENIVLFLTWKRDLEEIIENMRDDADKVTRLEMNAVLKRVQRALEALK